MDLLTAVCLWTLAASDPVSRTVLLDRSSATQPIQIQCPIGKETRLTLPERLVLLKASPGAAEDLGVEARSSVPFGVLVIRPAKLAQGMLEIRGPTLSLVVLVKAVETGGPSEVQLRLRPLSDAAPPPGPSPKPSPKTESSSAEVEEPKAELTPAPRDAPPSTVPAPSAPNPVPSPAGVRVEAAATGSIPPSTSTPAFALDLQGLLSARSVSVGRKEGLPGQRPLVLEDAFRGGQRTWLRLLLRGGGAEVVDDVSIDARPISTYTQGVEGSHLRLVVQLENALLKKKSALTVRLHGGVTYRFAALTPDTFTSLWKTLF